MSSSHKEKKILSFFPVCMWDDLNLLWSSFHSIWKSSHYVVHLKIIQCWCQPYLNKTGGEMSPDIAKWEPLLQTMPTIPQKEHLLVPFAHFHILGNVYQQARTNIPPTPPPTHLFWTHPVRWKNPLNWAEGEKKKARNILNLRSFEWSARATVGEKQENLF